MPARVGAHGAVRDLKGAIGLADPQFVHLRVHSACSLLEGAVQVKALPKIAAEAGMPAVAITDSGNLFAALEFSVGAIGAGIQPIVGCQIDLAYDAAGPGEKPQPPAPARLLWAQGAGKSGRAGS